MIFLAFCFLAVFACGCMAGAIVTRPFAYRDGFLRALSVAFREIDALKSARVGDGRWIKRLIAQVRELDRARGTAVAATEAVGQLSKHL